MKVPPFPDFTRIFVDTSAYIALVRIADDNHKHADDIAKEIGKYSIRVYTTNFVIAETHAFLVSRSGHDLALRFITDLDASATNIIRIAAKDEERCKAVIKQYRDKDFSYTDCCSFAVMERIGIEHSFDFDDHFMQYRFTSLRNII